MHKLHVLASKDQRSASDLPDKTGVGIIPADRQGWAGPNLTSASTGTSAAHGSLPMAWAVDFKVQTHPDWRLGPPET
jgi:hypothetical protein